MAPEEYNLRRFYCHSVKDNINSRRTGSEINSVDLTPGTKTIKQAVGIVVEHIVVVVALVRFNPGPFSVPNPDEGEALIGPMHEQGHAFATRPFCRGSGAHPWP